ncbi:sensor histidine kinase [Mesobacillus foraminis]|uniref:sensor histidine kinase n=1 Tax=Mesobacillus foraminis TaxID=279826 RepID=UPI0039A170A2
MQNLKRITLQTKILVLISALILLIISLLAGIFAYIQAVDARNQVEQLGLQAARSISLMPELRQAIDENNLEVMFRPIAEQVKDQTRAGDIIIENRDKILYSHTNPGKIGGNSHDHNAHALIFGGAGTFETQGEEGRTIVAKVPIAADYGAYSQVIGTVSVEFLEKEIYKNIFNRIQKIVLVSMGVLILGLLGGTLLARSIRNETLGLEPHEISSLYLERNAILSSIKEGIIAFDDQGMITLINPSARMMLNVEETGKQIDEILPHSNVTDVLKSGKTKHHLEVSLNGKTFLFNVIPIYHQGSVKGAVSSFRDKTELKMLMDTISEVREYSEGLRAQTHEYSNKLYLLSGLIQLEKYQEAFQFIQKEFAIHQHQNRIIFNQIHDANVQAILLGKLGKASEKKIQLDIDSESYVDPLPAHIEVTDVITIIGNLIDNAFEAVMEQTEKKVTFSIMGLGSDIIIEVTDSGKGITEERMETLFTLGYSSKGKNRGYGLFNVKCIVESLGGTIEVSNDQHGGAIFTVYLPKSAVE